MFTRRRLATLGAAIALLVAIPLVVVAAGDFTDVPANNPHANDIEWLADADVTRGCNPPTNDRYCPDRPVLRDQMASFMRRLAEGRVVDAGQLEGYAASDLVTANYAQWGGDSIDDFDFTEPEILSTSVTAPVDGFLVVSALVNAEWDVDSTSGTGARVRATLRANGDPVGIQPYHAFDDAGVITQGGQTMSVDGLVMVPAGVHTISIEVTRVSGSAMLFIHDASISTIFTPFGAMEATPLSSTPPVESND